MCVYVCVGVGLSMRAVILPSSALDALARRAVELPMLFQIENPATGQRSHCGVMEFIADEGMCYMPHWVRAPAARSFVPLPFPSLPFPSALSVTQSEQMCVCVCVCVCVCLARFLRAPLPRETSLGRRTSLRRDERALHFRGTARH